MRILRRDSENLKSSIKSDPSSYGITIQGKKAVVATGSGYGCGSYVAISTNISSALTDLGLSTTSITSNNLILAITAYGTSGCTCGNGQSCSYISGPSYDSMTGIVTGVLYCDNCGHGHGGTVSWSIYCVY